MSQVRNNLLKPIKLFFDFFPFFYHVVPYYFYYRMYGSSYEYFCPYKSIAIKNNFESIRKVYDKLTDDFSKRTYLNVLFYRLTMDKQYFSDCVETTEQYFIPDLCNLTGEEILVDCGAFPGDTLEAYLKFNSTPKKYYLYEPELEKNQTIMNVIKKVGGDKYCLIRNVGVSDKNKTLSFSSNRGSGFLLPNDKDGVQKIEVVSLDDDIKENVSFIKMDIEGAEQDALKGCIEKLKNNPKLAISIYHKVEDLWEIPIFLFSFYPEGTKYIIRHYTCDYNETIFYVIPPKSGL